MEPKFIRRGTYIPAEDHRSLELKKQYFSDGSAIIVDEKGICLVERVAKYELDLPGQEAG